MKPLLLLAIVISSCAMDRRATFNVLTQMYLKQRVEDHVTEILEDVTFEINPGSLMRVKNFYFSPADLCQMYPKKDGPEAIKKIFKENKFWNKPHNDCAVNHLFTLLGKILHNSKPVLEIYLACYPYAVHVARYHNGKLEDTLLSRAVGLNDLDAIRLLLQKGAHPNYHLIKPDLLRSKLMECNNAKTYWESEPVCLELARHGADINSSHFAEIQSGNSLLNKNVLIVRHRLLKKCYDLIILSLRRTSSLQVPVHFLNLLPREMVEQLATFSFVANIQHYFRTLDERKILHQCLLPQEPLPKQG